MKDNKDNPNGEEKQLPIEVDQEENIINQDNVNKNEESSSDNKETKLENKTEDNQSENKTEDNKKDKKTEDNKKDEEKPKEEMVEIPKSRYNELISAEERAIEEIKRERAAMSNYRKRLDKQKEDFVEMASARILKKLINVKDDLQRIIDNGKNDIPAQHLEGLKLLEQRIDAMFESEGVGIIKIIPNKTIYDPTKHEAIMSQPNPDLPDNTILMVISNGFIMKDRVLKAAQVIISKKPPKEDKKQSESKEKDKQSESKEKDKQSESDEKDKQSEN